LISVGLVLLTMLLLVACSEPAAPVATTVPTAEPPTPTPLPRGGNLAIRLASDIPELRPWQPRSRGEEQVISLLYNGLTRLDEQLRPIPDLAERWDTTADGQTITFTLRPDISWHDGQPLTAVDVAFTLGALREVTPTTALLEDLTLIERVSTPTTRTVVMNLKERYAPIFSALAVPILPRHMFEGQQLGQINFWDKPIGTGPFQFATREPGQSITFEANKIFYRGFPLLDRVALIVAPDATIAREALRDGRLQLAEVPWETAQELEQQNGLLRGFYAENGYYFLAFNLREDRPFADLRLRRALSLVLDEPQLVADITNGQGIVLGNSAAPSSWADLVAAPNSGSDPLRAQGLLEEVGWQLPEGKTIREREGQPFTAQLFVNAADSRRVAAAERIAAAAATIGISVTVQPADFESVIRSKYAPPYDFDLLLGSWSNGSGDPAFADFMFYDPSDFALFHGSQVNQGPNDTRAVLNIGAFRDPAYDNQASAARQLYSIDERMQALKLAQERIGEQLPYIYLWADQIPVLLRPQLTTLDGPINLNTPNYLWNIERWFFQPAP
jgi:peptide/nickel transport system substrate-binding protein